MEPLQDERGFFARSWCQREFEKANLNIKIAQCNLAFNRLRGTVRGMHFQETPHQEVKLVRCTRGEIFDVIIDLRLDSDTFLEWIGVKLTATNRRMLYVPEGFAHGYQTLGDNVEVYYQVSEFYAPGAEKGVRWNDPRFEIDWPIKNNIIVSEKDKGWPLFDV
jgi:dTDP-4-dehydrorhamnose 3,5-epimerase